MTEFDWIITYSGKRFYPLNPRPEDIHIEDIAHALSILNRFTGHSKFPYSVAEHCLEVSYSLELYHNASERVQLAGLLHDASEAYVNDVARPLKNNLPEYKAIENKILDVIDEKFNVETRHSDVKLADTRTLVTEARYLCNGEKWYDDPGYPEPYSYTPSFQPWYFSEEKYLNRFNELAVWL